MRDPRRIPPIVILLHASRLLANTLYRGFCTASRTGVPPNSVTLQIDPIYDGPAPSDLCAANARLDDTAMSDGFLLRLLVRLPPFRRIYPG